MNPTISQISEEGDILSFTLSGADVSIANALRRTIISDIPTVVFYTDTHKANQCNITVNTTRLHNEILKHRLSCIPVHIKDMDTLPDKYVLEVDEKNDSETTMIITTEHFRIRNKTNDNYLTEEETRRIFPANPKTGMYIDFARLKPKISDSIPGEQLTLTADFSVHTAKDNSAFNIVSICSCTNSPDPIKIKEVWEEQEKKLLAENAAKEEINYAKQNFMVHDAQRYFVPNTFQFIMQTIGIYDNREILRKACAILQNHFVELTKYIDSDIIPVLISETTNENSFDIILEDGGYTLGLPIRHVLYEKYFVVEKIMTNCGFKKFHPHNQESTIRVAYKDAADKHLVMQHLRIACIDLANLYEKMYRMF
jgi:DNA-directed RNA polymerase alpha subunit